MQNLAAMRFGWEGAESVQSHSYLVPALFDILRGQEYDPSICRVIDVGCGNGLVTFRLSQAGYSIVGVEPSEDGVAEAKKAFPNLQIFQGSGYDDLRSRFGVFDVAICLEVIEHIYSPEKFMQSVSNVLKPNGVLIISTPYHSYLKNLALSLAGKWDFHHHPLVEHGHIKFWARQTLEELIRRCGMTPSGFYRVGRIPILAKSMIIVATKVAGD